MNQQNKSVQTTRRWVLLAMVLAMALGVYVLESLLPPPIPVAGAKLGLSNLFILFLLTAAGPWDALMVMVLKAVAGPMLAGSPMAILYALSGGMLAWLAMTGVLRLGKQRLGYVGVSVCGAAAHALGQVMMACALTGTWGIMGYLPLLTALSLPTGAFVGWSAWAMTTALKHVRGIRLPKIDNR